MPDFSVSSPSATKPCCGSRTIPAQWRSKLTISLMAALILLATGCGQKGPLYLPRAGATADQTENADCPEKRCRAKAPQQNPDSTEIQTAPYNPKM